MQTLYHQVAGEQCRINVYNDDRDIDAFQNFLALGDQFLAMDTESTGLNLFSATHKLRLLQIGNCNEAWVIRTDKYADVCRMVLRQPRNFICHNAPFDCLTVDRHLGVKLEEFMPKVWDTKIVAHLRDPRGREEGGIGLDLKTLSAKYVDPDAPDTQKELTRVFNSFGWTKSSGWARISIDHMTYLIYAGLDVLLTSRLFQRLLPAVHPMRELCKMEHKLQYLLAFLQRKGMLLDIPYIERLIIDFHNEYIDNCDIAATFGVDSVYANEQVSTQLVAMGESLTEMTASGALKVDRAVLEKLADVNIREGKRIGAREPNPLAEAVIHAKRARKWSEAYAEAFLEWRDSSNRLHPVINSLQARTARMSVSNPPAQQFPSGDWKIRRSFIPDPGMVMISSDFQAVEMRVLAALSKDYTMRDVIKRGEDLHTFTAAKVNGVTVAEFEARLKSGDKSAKQQRKIAKNIGFGKVYGGGAASVARLTGADEAGVREAMAAYDATFPGIKRYSQMLIKTAKEGLLEVVTPIGRRLPLDEDRLYAATNYMVQSTARDLLAQAIIRVFDNGLGDYILLPIHDELLGQAPIEDAKEIIEEIGRTMESTFQGVEITADPEVIGSSWGAGYGAPEILPPAPVWRERQLRAGQWAQDGLDLGI